MALINQELSTLGYQALYNLGCVLEENYSIKKCLEAVPGMMKSYMYLYIYMYLHLHVCNLTAIVFMNFSLRFALDISCTSFYSER